jgi:hypothetical protein
VPKSIRDLLSGCRSMLIRVILRSEEHPSILEKNKKIIKILTINFMQEKLKKYRTFENVNKN